MISFNKIDDWDIDFDSTVSFKAHLIEKMQVLIGVYYQLHSNRADDWESF